MPITTNNQEQAEALATVMEWSQWEDYLVSLFEANQAAKEVVTTHLLIGE